MDEGRDKPLPRLWLRDSPGHDTQKLFSVDWLADHERHKPRVRVDQSGVVAVVENPKPRELVFDWQIHEPGVLPFARFRESLAHKKESPTSFRGRNWRMTRLAKTGRESIG